MRSQCLDDRARVFRRRHELTSTLLKAWMPNKGAEGQAERGWSVLRIRYALIASTAAGCLLGRACIRESEIIGRGRRGVSCMGEQQMHGVLASCLLAPGKARVLVQRIGEDRRTDNGTGARGMLTATCFHHSEPAGQAVERSVRVRHVYDR
ncbi:hypothetical protein B0H14DRAFT_672403 [Mycena olivaceomarginata]|nr:hypothetical protein B0H14DRAFT_672403 [Mycena olivaceomarginata]